MPDERHRAASFAGSVTTKDERAKSLGVKVEAQYTVGEYDIVILSAEQSDGLETWLKENGYRIPEGATEVLGSYMKQKMHFFVAKVNLEEKAKLGTTYLRPLQVAYESPKFMLPIRLGTVNANGPQELFIYALTRKGRVETTNYRTVKLPTGMDVPLFVKEEFGDFYKAMFDRQVAKEEMRTRLHRVRVGHELVRPVRGRSALERTSCSSSASSGSTPGAGGRRATSGAAVRSPGGGAQEVYVTRLHLRYDREHFPEDLVFQETGDRENFQGRYVLRHPWKGEAKCDAAKKYLEELPKRAEQRGADARHAHRLADRKNPRPHEPRRPGAEGRGRQVVAEALEMRRTGARGALPGLPFRGRSGFTRSPRVRSC